MKTVTYKLTDGNDLTVEYDENAPCRICGLPVQDASMGGTDICPWCDCGRTVERLQAEVRRLQHE